MIIASKGDFKINWDCDKQCYTVYYKGNVLVDQKYKYIDVKTYVE